MTAKHEIEIPRPGMSPLRLTLESGRAVVVIGANGSGKTRLGVYVESRLARKPVQRIAAHKSLVLNDRVALISLERAAKALRYGYPDGEEGHKLGSRWGNNPAVHLLSDFDALLQHLFADHNRTASDY